MKKKKKTSIKQNTNTIASPTNSKWNTNPSKKKFKIKHVQHAHIQKKKKKKMQLQPNTFSHHRPTCKKKSSNRFWIFHYFLGLINKDIIILEISKPINDKKPKNSQN